MIVYIEYVLIDNFVIDFLLLKTTFFITGKVYSKKRVLFLSLLGAFFALLYPMITAHTVIVTAIKILFGLLLLTLSCSYENFKDYYVNLLVFFVLTFLTGGAVIGVFNLLAIDYSTEVSIALMILPTFILIKGITEVIRFIYRRKDQVQNSYQIELIYNKNVIKTNGFLDTGNNLYYKDKPASIISRSVFLRLTKGEMPKLNELDFSTVSGKGKIFCFNIDAIKIYISKTPNIYYNVTVGVSSRAVSTGYSVILHPFFGGNNYVESFVGQVEKIS